MKTIDIERLNLPAKLTALIEDIEARSPLPIYFEETSKDEDARGVARFEWGVCCVSLKVPEGLRHETICHELLHLQCCLDGFPMFEVISGCPDYDDNTISHALADLNSLIRHQVVYSKMVQLGYDPYAGLDEGIQLHFLPRLEDKDYCFGKGMPPKARHLFRVLKISEVLSFISSSALRKRVWKASKAKYPQALIVADRIVALIDGAGARTPQDCRKVLVDAIRILGIPKKTHEIYMEPYPLK